MYERRLKKTQKIYKENQFCFLLSVFFLYYDINGCGLGTVGVNQVDLRTCRQWDNAKCPQLSLPANHCLCLVTVGGVF